MSVLVTADDFGVSASVNEAIIKAHQAGTVHAASLMMGQPATDEAVQLAKQYPSLRVGLHVTILDGKAVLPPSEIPDLVDQNGYFHKNPARTWLKYFFQPALKTQLEKEVNAQFEAFRLTRLRLSHVDGHHHQHIHPRVFEQVVGLAKKGGAEWIRIPRENLRYWKNAAPRPEFLKWLHGLIYYALTRGQQKRLRREGFFTFDGLFCFLDTYSLTKEFVLKLLDMKIVGNYEFYFHPGASWNRDLEILLDPEVMKRIKSSSAVAEALDLEIPAAPEPLIQPTVLHKKFG